MKYTVINWINFEIKNNFDSYGYSCNDLRQLYEKPSFTKVEIYRDREKKLNRIYWVSGSKHQFVIYWNIKDSETWLIHDVRISQAHNYVKKD